MANLAVNEVYRASIYCVLGDQTSVNVVHYRITSIAGTPTEAQLAAGVEAIYATPMKSLMSDQVSFRGVGVQRLFPIPPRAQVFSLAAQGPGTQASDALPKQVSGLIAKRTVFAGRKFRGRFYMPFPAEGSNDPTQGRPSAAYLTSLAALATNMNSGPNIGSGGNTATAQHVIWHHSTSTFDDVVLNLARPYWATQRRRGDYGPTNASPI